MAAGISRISVRLKAPAVVNQSPREEMQEDDFSPVDFPSRGGIGCGRSQPITVIGLDGEVTVRCGGGPGRFAGCSMREARSGSRWRQECITVDQRSWWSGPRCDRWETHEMCA